MKGVRKPQAGSSLIEVVVALVIFLIIVLGLGNSVVGARRAGYTSREIAEATTLAADKVEHLRALAVTNSELASGTHNDSSNPLGPDGGTGGIYTRTWTVTTNLPVAGMKRVAMTVSWTDRGRASSITLVSFLAPI